MQKNKWVLGINPCIYGMNYHDPSAALFYGNKLICAIEEEKFNRIKGSKGIFPIKSIKKCCEIANINIKDIDLISVGYNPENRKKRMNLEFCKIFNNNLFNIIDKLKSDYPFSEKFFKKSAEKISLDLKSFSSKLDMSSKMRASIKILNEIGASKKIIFHDHHLCHAASAFYPSGFDKSLIIVIDGVGEFETLSIWKGEGKKIKKLEYRTLPYSLGYLYAAYTAFLGFKPWCNEGKTMALAPYGMKNKLLIKKLKIINKKLIEDCFGEDLELDLEKAIKKIEEELNIKRRNKGKPIKSIHKNIAFAIQHYLESEVSNVIKNSIRKYKIKNICCSGGVFLNCKMNGVLRELKEIRLSYFQPVSKDSGLSLGAALLEVNRPNEFKLNHLALGELFEDKYIQSVLKRRNIKFKKVEDCSRLIAEKISKKKIIFWFNSRTEFGPRSLGSRSILADPRERKLSNYINKNIKHREEWRPFACSILEENSSDVLEKFERQSPFMIEAYKVKKEWALKIPGVIHSADGTTRPQTVNKESLKKYHGLIYEFYKITGIPLILNTSLNDVGEPIINTPEEALKYFFSSKADILALNNFIIEKYG